MLFVCQVEDLQDALNVAQRAKRSADGEVSEVNDRLQTAEITKMEAENRISTLQSQVRKIKQEKCYNAKRKMKLSGVRHVKIVIILVACNPSDG